MWIHVAAPHHTTKPSWGGDAHAGLKRTPGFRQNKVPAKTNITEKPDLDRGCVRLIASAIHFNEFKSRICISNSNVKREISERWL